MESIGRCNTLREGVAMNTRKRSSDRSGRSPLSSPGRPSVAGRDGRRRFWERIAIGLSSEGAAIGAGVPQAVGTRWFRKAGGMPPAMYGRWAKPLTGRYLSFAEREELAILYAQGGVGCGRLADRWGGQDRRSRGSFDGMPRHAVVAWSIERPLRSGMLSVLPGARSLRSWQPMQHCGPMCRSAWLE